MKVSELLRELALGEFSNMALAESGTIAPERIPQVILYTNEALYRIYTRFCLKQQDLVLALYGHITYYHFLPRFTHSKHNEFGERYPYIMDTEADPFTEDVIRVLTVYDSFGQHLPINDSELSNSVFTPQPNMLQVPNPSRANRLLVSYQASHPKLVADALDDEIELPAHLVSAMKAYIAFMHYNNLNTQEGQGIASGHLAKYESECAEVLNQDLVSTSVVTTNTRFEKRGFV